MQVVLDLLELFTESVAFLKSDHENGGCVEVSASFRARCVLSVFEIWFCSLISNRQKGSSFNLWLMGKPKFASFDPNLDYPIDPKDTVLVKNKSTNQNQIRA